MIWFHISKDVHITKNFALVKNFEKNIWWDSYRLLFMEFLQVDLIFRIIEEFEYHLAVFSIMDSRI